MYGDHIGFYFTRRMLLIISQTCLLAFRAITFAHCARMFACYPWLWVWSVLKLCMIVAACEGMTFCIDCEAAISGISNDAVDLTAPPTTPDGETWYYGSGITIQLDATTAGLLANIRRNTSPYNDYEAGTDLIKFNSLTGISAAEAVPIARSTLETNPVTGQMSLTSVYGMFGGFVPLGAATTDGSPHPYGGTGFGFNQVGFYPADWSEPFPSGMPYPLQMYQFTYDGNEFSSSEPVRLDGGLRIGDTNYYITARGLSAAIPDGNDLLYACKAGSYSGVARFQYDSTTGWQPTSFMPVAISGSEPSMIRGADGSLLFSHRTGTDIKLWRSDDGGTTWSQTLNVTDARQDSPVVLNRAADGTPFFSANSSSDLGARNHLIILPVNSDFTGLENPITVKMGSNDFGSSPEDRGWDVDMGFANVVQLADGELHGALIHRVEATAEHYGYSGTEFTGLYVEEVFSGGDPLPIWTFLPDPAVEVKLGIVDNGCPTVGLHSYTLTATGPGITSLSKFTIDGKVHQVFDSEGNASEWLGDGSASATEETDSYVIFGNLRIPDLGGESWDYDAYPEGPPVKVTKEEIIDSGNSGMGTLSNYDDSITPIWDSYLKTGAPSADDEVVEMMQLVVADGGGFTINLSLVTTTDHDPTTGELTLTTHDLTFSLPTLTAGDANGDGVVDALDAGVLAENWQKPSGATFAEGDFNLDGAVNDLDAAILAANWNAPPGNVSVPEPEISVLFGGVMTMLLLTLYRRRPDRSGAGKRYVTSTF